MPLDAITISGLAGELNERLPGMKISHMVMPSPVAELRPMQA